MLNYNFIHPNKIRQVLMLSCVLLLGYLLFSQMAFMLNAFLGALALYMLMRKPMFKMVYEWKMKKWLVTLLLVLASLIVIVLPFAFIINIIIDKLGPIIQNTTLINDTLLKIETFVLDKSGVDILSKANVSKIPDFLTRFGAKAVGSTLGAFTNLVVMYFVLWFMLVNGGNMERWLRNNLPFKSINTSILLQEVRSMVFSNTIGIPVLGAIQGVLAILGYYIFKVDEPVLWGIITGIASVIPFVGTLAVWVPIVILKFAGGEVTNGYWLLAWGLIVIGSSDNVIRFVLQKYIADVHPLITVFGVIIGLNLFGFFGLIFGPLLLSIFLLLVRIYRDEFALSSEDKLEDKLINNE